MSTDHIKNLWGHDFRVVSEGLAEFDVVSFVEKLMSEQHDAQRHLAYAESLKDLATRTIEGAERMAAQITEDAETEIARKSTGVIAEAERRAQEIVEQAIEAGAAVEERARRLAEDRLYELKESFGIMRDMSNEEVSAMTSMEDKVHSYLTSLKSFLSLMDNPFDLNSTSPITPQADLSETKEAVLETLALPREVAPEDPEEAQATLETPEALEEAAPEASSQDDAVSEAPVEVADEASEEAPAPEEAPQARPATVTRLNFGTASTTP